MYTLNNQGVYVSYLIGPHFEFLLQLLNCIAETAVCLHEVIDRLHGVNDRGMVPASEVVAYGFQRMVGEFLAEIHGDLTGRYYFLFTGLGFQIIHIDPVVFCYGFLDKVYPYLSLNVLDDIFHHGFGQFQADFHPTQRSMCDQGNQNPFKLPHIGIHSICQVLHHRGSQFPPIAFCAV